MLKKNKKVLIYGLKITGEACVDYFINHGYKVFVYDDAFIQENSQYKVIESVEEVKREKINLCITSPIIDIQNNEFCKTLQLLKVRVQTEVEFSLSKTKGKVVAITGTNGKTTTCSLIYNILKSAGYNCFLAGNVGSPLIKHIDETNKKSYIVLELSSFMLENIKRPSFFVSCLLNISCDHINWHGSFEKYIHAKEKILKYQKKTNYVAINYDDERVREMGKHLSGDVFYFSKNETIRGCFIRNGQVRFCDEDFDDVFDIKKIGLYGEKNLENVLCATLVSKLVGVNDNIISKSVSGFKPLKHRLNYICEKKGVKFFNDSKATNISSTCSALSCFKENVILMLGGLCKEQDFDTFFAIKHEQVKKYIIFGKDSKIIEKSCKKYVKSGNYISFDSFYTAFDYMKSQLSTGDIVLLSPACASFDEFENFEQRGEIFCEKVNEIS